MRVHGWPRAGLLPVLVAILAAASGAAAAGCGSPDASPATADHGRVVGYLRIPYQLTTEADTGAPRTVSVLVHPGERFAIKVATSDGPFVWRPVGPAPDGRVVRTIGNVNDGHCAAAAVGCRVPYFHVMRAKAAGHTSVTWLYRQLSCYALRKKMTQSTRSCVASITFDITVR